MSLSQIRSWTLTKATDDDRTDSLEVGGFERGSFRAPAEITPANFQVEVSIDGTVFAAVKADDAGNDVGAVALATSKIFPIPANVFKSKYARVFLSAGQAADRVFAVHLAGN